MDRREMMGEALWQPFMHNYLHLHLHDALPPYDDCCQSWVSKVGR